MIKPLKRLMLRAARHCYQQAAGNRRGKKILLVAHNRLMLDYLDNFRQVLANDHRLDFSVTSHSTSDIRIISTWCAEQRLPLIPFRKSQIYPWDLIVFADHWIASAFDPNVPKFLVNHAISGGKISGGIPYRYNPILTRQPDGRPLYTRIFEASRLVCDQVLREHPWLSDIIDVVGDQRADRLLALQKDRDAIRRSIGYKPTDKVVLVQSTWGVSIMEDMGEELIAACQQLSRGSDYRFIFSTHPKHWHGTYAQQHPWGEFLSKQERFGNRVLRSEDDWEPWMIASDLAVTDHTSLTVTYALLGKPMLYVALPNAALVEGFPIWRLANILPRLTTPDQLEADLTRAFAVFPAPAVAQIAHDVVAWPGEAADRIRATSYKVLAMTEPAAP